MSAAYRGYGHRRSSSTMKQPNLHGPKLADVYTPEQIEALRRELVPSSHATPVRFQLNGQTIFLESGYLQPKGIKVIYQYVYWNSTRATAEKIAAALNVKAIFSE
jgi:hypothetical protein